MKRSPGTLNVSSSDLIDNSRYSHGYVQIWYRARINLNGRNISELNENRNEIVL